MPRTGLVKKERVEVTGNTGGFLFCRLRHQLMARSETGGTKQEPDPDTPVENLKIVNQKYAYHPDPNKPRTTDGQIVGFVVSECNANWSHYLSKTLSILEYLGVRFNGDWSSSGPTFYVANRERWWPTPIINCINRRING